MQGGREIQDVGSGHGTVCFYGRGNWALTQNVGDCSIISPPAFLPDQVTQNGTDASFPASYHAPQISIKWRKTNKQTGRCKCNTLFYYTEDASYRQS